MLLKSIHDTNYLLSLVVILIALAYLIILSVRQERKDETKKVGKYVYFVSYYYVGGNGRIEITLDREITNIKVVSDIEKWIAREYRIEQLVVKNYILPRTDNTEAPIDSLKYN